MTAIGAIERQVQNKVIKHFVENLCYEYLGNWQDRTDNGCVEVQLLMQNLVARGYDPALAQKAVDRFSEAAEAQSRSLFDVNKDIYRLLRYGVKVKLSLGEQDQTVWLIDWGNTNANHFAIAEEVTVAGEHDKRPDVVLYVNGIALGVIELKRSIVSVSEGIRQNLDNQKPLFIKHFFHCMQLVMAANETEGLRYGTIETPEAYYLKWKEQHHEAESTLYDHLGQLLSKDRLLDILHNFVVFDAGIKKICRPNQFFGVKNAQEYVERREGGIIWHTQGSGKSLTMVWLAKWLREFKQARVLVITDRIELDDQIGGVFADADEKMYKATSASDLVKVLQSTEKWLIRSLVHKFGKTSATNYDSYIEELKRSLPADFAPKGNIFVFVDECHRTQGGKLNKAMRDILPDALFIGFTGTPLLKRDKQTSLEIFGPYIHTYKFDEAVADNVVLDLQYEARDIEQRLTSTEKIDQWFDIKTRGLNDAARSQLKKRWGTMQKVLSAQSRLEKIVMDILLDMGTKERLANGRGNAMLVAGSIYEACKYYELFIARGFTKCAIVTSYVPNIANIKGESVPDAGDTEELKKYDVYQKMLNGQDPVKFEEDVKAKFTDEPGQMKLLIVVNKLLTGFDAPPATYMYIDQSMQDHGLFQAICRVNRLDGDDKLFGYVIDYKDLFKSIEKSVKDYTSGAFEQFDAQDVAGLLQDRLSKIKDKLDETREQLVALTEPVPLPRESYQYQWYFCGSPTEVDFDQEKYERRREMLYRLSATYARLYADIANDLEDIDYTPAEAGELKADVSHYQNLGAEIRLASGDYIDLKMYEPAMRQLLDSYLVADESKVISAFDDLSLVDMIVNQGAAAAVDNMPDAIRKNAIALAEVIENNVRKLIVDEHPQNPAYFTRMSELLTVIIEKRRQQQIDYQKYLQEIENLARKIKNGEDEYPSEINTPALHALYDNTGKNIDLALEVHAAVLANKKDNFRENLFKQRALKNAIRPYVAEDMLESVFEIIKQQREY